MGCIFSWMGSVVPLYGFKNSTMGLNKAEYYKIGILMVIFVGGIIWAIRIQTPDPKLPILNPSDLNPAVVADSLEGVGINHVVAPFILIDQTGTVRTEADVQGKIRVVNYFFTTCPSICKDMAHHLRTVQAAYRDNKAVQLLSHTAMPEYDTPEILAAYAHQNQVNPHRWWLLTGEPEELNRLARTSYFAVLEAGQGWDEHSFIHTENLVLVDHKGRLRGYYDGTSEEETSLLIAHIGWLLKERSADFIKSSKAK
jgi:protein SCO1